MTRSKRCATPGYHDWLSFCALGLDEEKVEPHVAASAGEVEHPRFVSIADAHPVPRAAYCDTGSKVMFTDIGQAVSDVQEELEAEEVHVNPFFKEKLDYWDTDICHCANTTMREVQLCESSTKLPTAASAHTSGDCRGELRIWHRQRAAGTLQHDSEAQPPT